MTLGEFFEKCGDSPSIIIFYFVAIPAIAFLLYMWAKDEGHKSPWNYIYSLLIYLVCIPGIFAVTLSVYLFMFERKSIFDTDMYLQILPLLSMAITLWIIKLNVEFKQIPGFGRLSSLMMVITVVMGLLWILEKTHIFAITFVPFQYVALIMVAIFAAIFIGSKRVFK